MTKAGQRETHKAAVWKPGLVDWRTTGETNHSGAVSEKNDRRNEARESQAVGEAFSPLRVKRNCSCSLMQRSRKKTGNSLTDEEGLRLFFEDSNFLLQMLNSLEQVFSGW